MEIDFWADYYERAAASGDERLFEDDSFDLDRILEEVERDADNESDGESWEEAGSWDFDTDKTDK